jgi:hypothetical protein
MDFEINGGGIGSNPLIMASSSILESQPKPHISSHNKENKSRLRNTVEQEPLDLGIGQGGLTVGGFQLHGRETTAKQ